MPHSTTHTEFTPALYPHFPISDSYKTIALETISLQKLLAQDSAEESRVFEACKTRGFFYLELAGCESGKIIKEGADDLCRVAEEFFKLPMDVKDGLRMQSGQLDGYKHAGATKTDSTGRRDTAEFLNVPKNEFAPPTPPPSSHTWPDPIESSRPLFSTYMRTAHATGLMLLSILASRLGIPASDLLSRHRLEERSGDIVRLTRGPPREVEEMPEIQTPSHTDFGTITLLMNWLGGLQVWSSSARSAGPLEPDSEGEWLWVPPKPGHAIINLGDAMVKFTNGALCSGRHRVVPAPGSQGVWPRFSIVYFVRPEDQTILERLEGDGVPPLKMGGGAEEKVTAKEWIMRQARGLGTKFLDN